MKVTVRTLNEDAEQVVVGTLTLQGGKVVPEPADDPVLKMEARGTTGVPPKLRREGGPSRASAKDDPELYLRALPYRSNAYTSYELSED